METTFDFSCASDVRHVVDTFKLFRALGWDVDSK